jgi:hypothetical protein
MKEDNCNAARNLMGMKWPFEIRFRETTVSHMHIGSDTRHNTQYVTSEEIEVCQTRKLYLSISPT